MTNYSEQDIRQELMEELKTTKEVLKEEQALVLKLYKENAALRNELYEKHLRHIVTGRPQKQLPYSTIERIVQLRKEGTSYRKIAELVKVSEGLSFSHEKIRMICVNEGVK